MSLEHYSSKLCLKTIQVTRLVAVMLTAGLKRRENVVHVWCTYAFSEEEGGWRGAASRKCYMYLNATVCHIFRKIYVNNSVLGHKQVVFNFTFLL